MSQKLAGNALFNEDELVKLAAITGWSISEIIFGRTETPSDIYEELLEESRKHSTEFIQMMTLTLKTLDKEE